MSDPRVGAPPAGWYPDGQGGQRYWDGARWTEHQAHRGELVVNPQPHVSAPGPMVVHGMATYGVQVVAPKNPGLALVCSFFIPGLGQFVNGEGSKGALFLIGYIVSWVLVFVLIGIPMIFAVWIWSMVDAFTSAKNWNARHGIIS